MKILVTGAAGFIGYHTCLKFLSAGHNVVGLDNLNDYYSVDLKNGRLTELGFEISSIAEEQLIPSRRHSGLRFIKLDICDGVRLAELFASEKFDAVCHLAGQAGVRYSLINAQAYFQSNLTGMGNILEACRHHATKHLVYASSSSVYGLNSSIPFRTADSTDHPASLYAATKKANELMAHSYSHLYKLPTTGLRLFTVYGPWGRPDMAIFLFTKAIVEGTTLDVFNGGNLERDFTFVADVVEAILAAVLHPPTASASWDSNHPDAATSSAPYRIYNVGNSRPVALMDFIKGIERAVGKPAKLNFLEMQPGDVFKTWADTSILEKELGYRPNTLLQDGLDQFVAWYKSYYR